MRYGLWSSAAIFCLLACFAEAFSANKPKAISNVPNILLIVVDDLRSDALGVTGHPFFKSPSIDRLANEGVLFQNSFVVHSLCSPSRATLMTGLYSHQHRVLDNDTPLNPQLPTVAQLLRAAGYETAFIGKWHMGYYNATPKPGFDRWVSFIGQGKYLNPIINVDGEKFQASGHITDILTNYALDFLASNRQKPFFLVLSHKAVHAPFTAQARFYRIYENANIIFPATKGEDLSDKPAFLQAYSEFFKQDLKLRIRQYYECFAGVEEGVGKILAKLTQKNELDNTLIIFTGDNGFLLGEHNLGDKRLAYEESMRVPLLARYPAWFPSGTRSQTFALNIDLMPTVLDAAGVSAARNLPGISLRRLATGAAQRNCFLYEYFPDLALPIIPPMRAIRTPDYKYVKYFGPNVIDELYDMRNDPIESNNLITYPALSGVLSRLRFQLDSLRIAAYDTSALDTAVEVQTYGQPASFELYQNYPNPLTAGGIFGIPITTIRYALSKSGPVRLEIFDLTGRKVATLVDAIQGPGFRAVRWNASRFDNGVYFCRLQAGAFVQTRKMIVLR
jgi:N-acetylglucosamine-6-sulfatase